MKFVKALALSTASEYWQNMLWGEDYHQAISAAVQPWLGKLFGAHLLKIGKLSSTINTSQCPIIHQVNVGTDVRYCQVIAREEQLPFFSKSVDACLLINTLGANLMPHTVLREADRILADDGWMIISELNPLSLLGALAWVPGLRKPLTDGNSLLSSVRINDWLRLLNYQIIIHQQLQCLPWQPVEKNPPLALGCINFWVLRKRSYPLTLEKNRNVATSNKLATVANISHQCRGDSNQESKE